MVFPSYSNVFPASAIHQDALSPILIQKIPLRNGWDPPLLQSGSSSHCVGEKLGSDDGCALATLLGILLGEFDGNLLGASEGVLLGKFDGNEDGNELGTFEGNEDG